MAKKRKRKPKPQTEPDPQDKSGEAWEVSAVSREGEGEVPSTDSETYVAGILGDLGEPSGMGPVDDDWFGN